MNQVDFIRSQETHETAKLSGEVPIIKTGQWIFANFADAESICFDAQRTFVLQACQLHAAKSARLQETRELQRLALSTALLEAVDDVQNVRFQSRSPPPREFDRVAPQARTCGARQQIFDATIPA